MTRRVCLHGQDTEREGALMDIRPRHPLPLARLLLEEFLVSPMAQVGKLTL